jgi:hypothetical protein
MSWMQQGKGKLLFRHAPLGLGETCGHGHADALAVLLSWDDVPLLTDLGSGQYNGDQSIRNYFRSTIAHNTVEINGQSQAKMQGPFLWQKSYRVDLLKSGTRPHLFAEAKHDGYLQQFGLIHKRRIDWISSRSLQIKDHFSGKRSAQIKGAFHLGGCRKVTQVGKSIQAEFGVVMLSITFPEAMELQVFYGSTHPFIGWKSTVYGQWKPIYSVVFSRYFDQHLEYIIHLDIEERKQQPRKQ